MARDSKLPEVADSELSYFSHASSSAEKNIGFVSIDIINMGGKNFREFEVLMQGIADAVAKGKDMGTINELRMSAADPVTNDFQLKVKWLKELLDRKGIQALSIIMGGDEITIVVNDYTKITSELLLEIKTQTEGRVYGTTGINSIKERFFKERGAAVVSLRRKTGYSKVSSSLVSNWLAWTRMKLLMDEGINSLKFIEAGGRYDVVLMEDKEGNPQEISPAMNSQVPEIGVWNDHQAVVFQISRGIEAGKIPKGAFVINVDEHSDDREDTTEGVDSGNWLTVLQEQGMIGGALWVYPEGRKHDIRSTGSDTWFKGSGTDLEKLIEAHIDQLRGGVILSIDQDYFVSSRGNNGSPEVNGLKKEKLVEV